MQISATPPPTERAELQQAARQFEAMMFAQLLDQAMPASGPDGEWRQMAHRAVADTLAGTGSLGIAQLLTMKEKP